MNWLIDFLHKQEQKYNLEKDDLVWGLVLSLVGGLVLSLVGGLVLSLVGGLVGGLVWSLVWSLVWGLVWGLGVGLVVGLGMSLGVGITLNIVSSFTTADPSNWWIYILIIIALGELLFFLDKERIDLRQSGFWFTAKKKAISLLYSLGITTQVLGSIANLRLLKPEIVKYWPEILKWPGYIGTGLIVLIGIAATLFLYIKINQWLKYGDKRR